MATEKKLFTAYEGTEITFFPNSHRYQRAGEKTYLLSPSAVVGVIDKSRALLSWNDGLIRNFFGNKILETESYSKNDIISLTDEALKQRLVKLEEAQDVGTQIHDFAEAYAYLQVMGVENLPTRESIEAEIHYDEQVKQGKLAFLDFIKENQVEFIDVENFVYGYVEDGSDKIFYSGMFDVKMKIKGKVCLGDWKSSKGVYSSQKYQLGGYDLAEMQKIKYLKELGKDTSSLEYDAVVIIHIDKNTGIFTLHELTEEERIIARKRFEDLTRVKNTEKAWDKWDK